MAPRKNPSKAPTPAPAAPTSTEPTVTPTELAAATAPAPAAATEPTTPAATAAAEPTTPAAIAAAEPTTPTATAAAEPTTPAATAEAAAVVEPTAATEVPVPAQITLPNHRARLLAAHEHLSGLRGYLANPAIVTRCSWMRDGKCQRLVFNTEHEPGAVKDETVLEVPQPAELCVVGIISKDDFWLTSDAGWRGPTEFSPSFAKVKASGCWETPSLAPFAADFPLALKNLHALEAKMVTPGFTQTKSSMVGLGGVRIKIKHALFDPRMDTEEEELTAEAVEGVEADPIDELRGRIPVPLTLENWPVRSDAAREALQEMKGKFYVVPIPAYDMHGDLIHPDSYRRRLEGALAAVRFNLVHWAIKGRGGPGTDIYVADIVNIRVISPPAPVPVTPRKRGRVPAFDPLSPRPSNKTRRLWE